MKTQEDWDVLVDEIAQLRLKLRRSETERDRLEHLKKSHEAHLMATMRDIEKARSEVVESERDLALILEATGDAYFVADANGIARSERLSEFLVDLKVPSLIGQSIFIELGRHFNSQAFDSMNAASPHSVEVQGRMMLWIPKFLPAGVLWIVRDETIKKELHDELEASRMSQIAVAKMASLGEMAGGVAHEINTPLAIIKLRLEHLGERIEEQDYEEKDVVAALAIVTKTADRIAKIVNGLRLFSRDGSHGPTRPTPLIPIVEDTLSFCRERFKTHGIELIFEINEGDADTVIECRSVEISQVLLNLLNNSFDAVQLLAEKWVKIRISSHDSGVEIRVEDSGPGIPRAIQDRLMEPFFTTKEIGKGTGLGLSISRGILQSHGGSLSIDNSGKNTCFVMSLPVKTSKASPLSEAFEVVNIANR